MPKFSYKILDYDKETSLLAVSVKTDDPKVSDKESLINFECPLDDNGKVVSSTVKEAILSIVQNNYWSSWNYQNTPTDSPVGIDTVIGSTHEQEYSSSKRIWTPPAPPPQPEDDLVSSTAEEWSWLTSEEFAEWSDFKNRVKALEEKSG